MCAGTIREQLLIGLSLVESVELDLRGEAAENCGVLLALAKLLIINGGQRRDRTADAGLFMAA
jgi:hypothetical protein